MACDTYSYVKRTSVAGPQRVRGSIMQAEDWESDSKQIMACRSHGMRKIIAVTVWRMDWVWRWGWREGRSRLFCGNWGVYSSRISWEKNSCLPELFPWRVADGVLVSWFTPLITRRFISLHFLTMLEGRETGPALSLSPEKVLEHKDQQSQLLSGWCDLNSWQYSRGQNQKWNGKRWPGTPEIPPTNGF